MISFILSDFFKYDYLVSLSVIFIFNITIIFYMQRVFTFEGKKDRKLIGQFYKFTILVSIMLISLYIFIPILNSIFNNYSISTFFILFFITLINFIVQNFLIFNNKN